MSSEKQPFHDKNSEDALLRQYVDDISRYPRLTEDEERTLSVEILRGSEEAKEKLVRSNLMFVVSIARLYASPGVDMLDLVNEGNIAMIKAASRFDATKGKRFTQYAVWDIKRAMEAYLPDDRHGVRRGSADHLAGDGAQSDASAETATYGEMLTDVAGRLPERERAVVTALYGARDGHAALPTMAEVAAEMGLRRERVRQIRDRALRRIRKMKDKSIGNI